MKKFLVLAAALVAASGCAGSDRGLGARIDDSWIAMKARTRMMTQEFGRQMNVNIDVRDGVVTLKGEAASEAEKTKMEEIVRGVAGVTDVQNDLRVVADEDFRPSGETGRRWQERRAPATSY